MSPAQSWETDRIKLLGKYFEMQSISLIVVKRTWYNDLGRLPLESEKTLVLMPLTQSWEKMTVLKDTTKRKDIWSILKVIIWIWQRKKLHKLFRHNSCPSLQIQTSASSKCCKNYSIGCSIHYCKCILCKCEVWLMFYRKKQNN